MKSFTIDVHSNGIVITPLAYGQPSKVFELEHIEDALLEVYRQCTEWKVGDGVAAVRSHLWHGWMFRDTPRTGSTENRHVLSSKLTTDRSRPQRHTSTAAEEK